MAVKVGSARIDERGRISGGKAGDQTGNEVSTQSWYPHSKGWRTFRARDPAKAEKIAECMEWACASPLVGYDQNQNTTLFTALKAIGFKLKELAKKVETDCARLVRVCATYAGATVKDFSTATEAAALLASGEFVELKGDKYNKRSDYLCRGDIQVTKTKGHTIVILSNGSKAEGWGNIAPPVVYSLGDRILRNGMEGDDVKELQTQLIQLGYSCGSYGVDGEFGDATELAVQKFQQENGCEVDGEVGPETIAALEKALGDDDVDGYTVTIMGGDCFVRSAPNTSGSIYGVAREGEVYPYGGQRSADGWLLIEYKSLKAWVSGKYGRLA